MKLRQLPALLACLALAAGPLAAYTVVLKDGSRIEARGKYVVEGERAIITLVSGTETFLNASEIDVPATETANKHDLGNALVLEDGEFVQKKVVRGDEGKRDRLGDLIERGEASMRGTTRTDSVTAPARSPLSRATDIELVDRRPLRNIALATAIKAGFGERGFDGIAVYQGTAQGRPLVELKAESEASVFRGLEVAAEVLTNVREDFGDEFELIELLMMTANQQRAGEFEVTSELAEALVADGSDIASLFVQHVRF